MLITHIAIIKSTIPITLTLGKNVLLILSAIMPVMTWTIMKLCLAR